MARPTLWLVGIAAIVIAVVAFTRITDSVPGLSSPTTAVSTSEHDIAAPGTATPDTTTSVSSVTDATTVPTVTLPPGREACDVYSEINENGKVVSTALVEASGLAVSRVAPDVLWSHNDSRDAAVLYAMTPTGEDLGRIKLPGAFAFDWEDMAAGPDATGAGQYLYVGDIGDNFNIRGGQVAVYRVPDGDPETIGDTFPEVVSLPYRYPDGPHNAEALFIDPIDPALYLVTKSTDEAFVFRGSLAQVGDGPMELELIATLFLGAEVSSADISWDGGIIAFRGYSSVWMWTRDPGQSVADALSGQPCQAPAPDERQGEAIAFDAQLAYWTVSEGLEPEIHVVSADL
ncbi:MAG: hypothetical protein M3132_08430 [Actinomycetia bacterium]|nr:hypothetical protein [Actinomycetes bacterium]